MQIPWRGRAATSILGASVWAAAIAAGGCAHHRADQYTYAPPYAPPVYPQPQAPTPVAYAAAPANADPAGAIPAGVVPAAPTMAMPAGQPGEVVLAAGSPCPPCATEGMVVGATTMVEGGGQTPPCPPGR